jgi:hypothetical protein
MIKQRVKDQVSKKRQLFLHHMLMVGSLMVEGIILPMVPIFIELKPSFIGFSVLL